MGQTSSMSAVAEYRRSARRAGLALALLAVSVLPAPAQWLTQKTDLKAGWNAVFLHFDATYDTLGSLVGGDSTNPVLEIWRWNPPSLSQFTGSPATPSAVPEWSSWVRTNNAGSALQRLTGDSAYLVRVGTNVTNYVWSVKGKPVAPRREWTVSGLNLIGFSTVTSGPPTFTSFLARAPELQSATPEIYYYPGGDLGSNNPALLPSPLFPVMTVKRGQAYWMRSGTVFNRYFGPFEVINAGDNGVEFWDDGISASLRLKNLTSSNLTVSLRLLNSETPPAGQTNIVGVPPLLVRGALNMTNLTYGYSNLTVGSVYSWSLASRTNVGSELEIVLGLNRSTLTNAPGSLLAGVLSFTDSLGHTMVQMPVSALAASRAGLWVGDAQVSQVAHYLKTYARNTDGTPAQAVNGAYVVTNVDTSLGAVSKAFPLRLIVHNPTAPSNAVLLQRVYVGYDAATNTVITTGESGLNAAMLANARRISATHLPWSASNSFWSLNGAIGTTSNLSATVVVGYNDQASNPFLHTYHPDHDNLNATFNAVVPQGVESYRIERAITLNLAAPANDFDSLIAAGRKAGGSYLETVTLKGLARGGGTNETRQFQVQGTFELNLISDIPTLTVAP